MAETYVVVFRIEDEHGNIQTKHWRDDAATPLKAISEATHEYHKDGFEDGTVISFESVEVETDDGTVQAIPDDPMEHLTVSLEVTN